MKHIAAALAKAQTEMGKALKQSNNPHFKSKYADLGNVMDACLPALNAAGIAVIQPTGEDDHGRFVETVLIHESGESLVITWRGDPCDGYRPGDQVEARWCGGRWRIVESQSVDV